MLKSTQTDESKNLERTLHTLGFRNTANFKADSGVGYHITPGQEIVVLSDVTDLSARTRDGRTADGHEAGCGSQEARGHIRSVDLPHPLGPTRVVKDPDAICRKTSATAGTAPWRVIKVIDIPLNENRVTSVFTIGKPA